MSKGPSFMLILVDSKMSCPNDVFTPSYLLSATCPVELVEVDAVAPVEAVVLPL